MGFFVFLYHKADMWDLSSTEKKQLARIVLLSRCYATTFNHLGNKALHHTLNDIQTQRIVIKNVPNKNKSYSSLEFTL